MKAARPLIPALFGLPLLISGQAATLQSPPGPPPLSAAQLGRLAAMLPQSGQMVTVMRKQLVLSTVDLKLRVEKAGGSSQALSRVVASAKQGVRAPYDESLRISREEYYQYLVFGTELVDAEQLKLNVVRDAARVSFGFTPRLVSMQPPDVGDLRLTASGQILNGVAIDLRSGEMRGPEGFAARATEVKLTRSSGQVLNVVSGFQWRMQGSETTKFNGVQGTLSLLQLDTGHVILNYTRRSMMRGEMNAGEVILRYLPGR